MPNLAQRFPTIVEQLGTGVGWQSQFDTAPANGNVTAANAQLSKVVSSAVATVISTTQLVGGSALEGGSSDFDDFYNGQVLLFTSGSAAGQTPTITDYDGASRTITLGAAHTFSASDTFTIIFGTYVKVKLEASDESKTLILRGFEFNTHFDPVPNDDSGTTIVGVQARLECLQLGAGTADPDIEFSEVKIVKASQVQTLNRADSRAVRRSAFVGDVLTQGTEEVFGTLNATGRPNDDWGLTGVNALKTSDVRGSGFGIAIRVKNTGSNTVEVALDTAQLVVYFQRAFAAVLEVNGPTGEAPHFCRAFATRSSFGVYLPEECEARWTVEGPQGWAMTATDPRSGQGGERDCATEAVGYTMGWVFDVDGDYDITLTLVAPDGTTSTDDATVSVDPDDRTHYYVSSVSGDDENSGLAPEEAWETLERALDSNHSAPDVDAMIHLAAGETFPVESQINMDEYTNIVVTGDPTDPPVISITAPVGIQMGGCNQIVFRELRVESPNSDAPSMAFKTTADNSNLCWTEIEFGDLQTFCLLESGSMVNSSNYLFHNCTGGRTREYFLYANEHTRTVVLIGYHGQRYEDGGLIDGHVRLEVRRSNSAGAFNASFYWCRCESNDTLRFASLRQYWSYCSVYQCRCDYAPVGFDSFAGGGPWVGPVYVFRGDGLEVISAATIISGRHGFLCNSRLIAEVDGVGGDPVAEALRIRGSTDQFQLKNCTLSTTLLNTNGIVTFADPPVAPERDNQYAQVNNVFVFGGATGLSTDMFLSDRSDSETEVADTVVRQSANNVWYPDSSEPGPTRFVLYPNNNPGLSFVGWDGLSITTNEVTENCDPSDFPAGSSYLPDSSLTVVRGAGLPTGGVHRDYRGVARNPSASSWFAGCTSDDLQ